MNKLWNKNFTIITLGTVVSMLGNAISGFAISLLVLDYSGSTFLYALFMVIYMLPRIVMPVLSGPYLDRYSRRKMIYTLDFASAALYTAMFFILTYGAFSYPLFIVLAFIIGSIDSTYQVAYDSLYPTLVAEENYRKAYSISSMLYPLSAVMVPVAAFLYGKIGVAPLFLFNAATFLVAACFETQIRSDETHIKKNSALGLRGYTQTFKEGLAYLKSERGLLLITLYFCFNSFAYTGADTLLLPYFKATPSLGVLMYTLVMGCGIAGRFFGGLLHYTIRYPAKKKFVITCFVYIMISLLEGTYLYLPVVLMCVMNFAFGLLAVTSYNIRISSTQSYIPNEYRARFNGAFQMFNNVGSIAGPLLAGAVADYCSQRAVVSGFMAVNLIAVLVIIIPGAKLVKPIYNREV